MVKKITVFLLLFTFALGLAACANSSSPGVTEKDEPENSHLSINSSNSIPLEQEPISESDFTSNIQLSPNEVKFGRYEQDGDDSNGQEPIEWIVLEEKNGKALLLSKYGLDSRTYNPHGEIRDCSWKASNIRAWLNGEFFNTAFTVEEQKYIFLTELEPETNPVYGTKIGEKTADKVFLPSLSEIENHFEIQETWSYLGEDYHTSDTQKAPGGSPDLVCAPTQYAFSQGCGALGSEPVLAYGTQVKTLPENPSCWWQLRTPGKEDFSVVWVSPYGSVSTAGISQHSGRGTGNNEGYGRPAVRPAIWVDVAVLSGVNAGTIPPVQVIHKVDTSNTIFFGSFEQDGDMSNGPEPIEWIKVTEKDGRVLLLSKYVLDRQDYTTKTYGTVTWEVCTLRSYLNGQFYNSAFSDDEKNKIVETTLSNPDSIEFYSIVRSILSGQGGADTSDRVFLLSLEELQEYFGVDPENHEKYIEELCCEATKYALKRGAYESSGMAPWLLRSPGLTNSASASVHAYGHIDFTAILTGNGLRPAMWIDIG